MQRVHNSLYTEKGLAPVKHLFTGGWEVTRDSIMPSRSVPIHPGRVLRDRVLPGLALSVSAAARMLRISRQALHAILAGTAAVTPEMALRFARLSDTQPEFWLTLQQNHDLWRAEEDMVDVLRNIPTHPLPDTLRAEIGCHGHAP